MADPVVDGQDADLRLQTCLNLVRKLGVRKRQPKRAKRPHSIILLPQGIQDGPATRPDTPLAVENSVGKLAAN
jgi:hypothetical protein